MNTLRKAVREYLELRRSLGFKLREAGKGLIDFVTFLERHKRLHYSGPGTCLGSTTLNARRHTGLNG